MTRALHRIAEQAHPGFPVTVYYAFKQSERKGDTGVASTGWKTFLGAVIRSGFVISGTWPMRTELGNLMIGMGTNALASSVVLVCRRRPADAPTATRRECVTALRAELPPALRLLQTGNIAPVDLAQAAIGPGMAVYTRYGRICPIVSGVDDLKVYGDSHGPEDRRLRVHSREGDSTTRWQSICEQNDVRRGRGRRGRARCGKTRIATLTSSAGWSSVLEGPSREGRLIRDLSADNAFFVFNREAESVERLLAHKKQQWDHNIVPENGVPVDRLRGAFQVAFKNYKARTRT